VFPLGYAGVNMLYLTHSHPRPAYTRPRPSLMARCHVVRVAPARSGRWRLGYIALHMCGVETRERARAVCRRRESSVNRCVEETNRVRALLGMKPLQGTGAQLALTRTRTRTRT